MTIALNPCPGCGGPIHRGSPQCLACRRAGKAPSVPATPAERVTRDRESASHQASMSGLRASYAEALKVIERQEKALAAVGALAEPPRLLTIEPKKGSRTSEGTAVMVASDWHIEETVGPEVDGLNVFNLSIAERRARQFFQHGLRLVQLLQQDISISTIVLALLGDFITNDIHDGEQAEMNQIAPMEAIARAQGMLISGIEFLLANSTCNLLIPCHSGNHARTTRKTRFHAENGHSLEYLMYLHLQAYFRHEKRVLFLVAPGMHSYVQVYDQMIRFQHGHAIKYNGGVGGIYIPTNKAIAQWNRARHADLDVFGHFHQLRDGGQFVCNGSLIGYNAFALSIKADFEKPRQALFLMDKKRGRTCTWPILVS